MPASRTTAPTETERARYYTAALRALRFVEHRSPTTRRFGTEADARWGAFRGSLTTADRLDLLIRDADAHWTSAFGARTVFRLGSAAEDEAFGALWEPLDPVQAEELWRAELDAATPSSTEDALRAAARAWDLALSPVDVGPIDASDRLLVVGPSAIVAVVLVFASDKDLDWSAQVLCTASAPGHRQLAALAGALLQTQRPTTFDTENAAGRRLVTSPDALPEDIAHARSLLGLPADERA